MADRATDFQLLFLPIKPVRPATRLVQFLCHVRRRGFSLVIDEYACLRAFPDQWWRRRSDGLRLPAVFRWDRRKARISFPGVRHVAVKLWLCHRNHWLPLRI